MGLIIKSNVILIISYCISTVCMEPGLPNCRLEKNLRNAITKLTQAEMATLWNIQRLSKTYNPALFAKDPKARIALATTDLLLELPSWQPSPSLKSAVQALCCILERAPNQPSLTVKLLLPHLAKKLLPWFNPVLILVTMQAPFGGKLLEEKEISCKDCGNMRSSNNECNFCYKKNKIIKNLQSGLNELNSQEIAYMRRVNDCFLEEAPTINTTFKPSESLIICIYEKTGLVNQPPTYHLARMINIFAAGVHLLEKSQQDTELEKFIRTSAEETCKQFTQKLGKLLK